MTFPGLIAVLDANTLIPDYLRSTLLWMATTGLFQPRWSDTILHEVRRHLTKRGRDEQFFAKLFDAMTNHFPHANVLIDETLIETIVLPDPDDRHVVAAAIVANASTIVTFNVRDFPMVGAGFANIQVVTPDDFLLDFLANDAGSVADALAEQVNAFHRPDDDLPFLISRLQRVVPRFAAEITRRPDLLADIR